MSKQTFFVFLLQNEANRREYTGYYFLTVEIKDQNFIINGRKFLINPLEMIQKRMKTLQKIATNRGDDYTSGCLLNYPYFIGNHKLIAIDLSKQQEFDANPNAMQQNNFTGNLGHVEVEWMVFNFKEIKETILNFLQGATRVLQALVINLKHNNKFILV